MARTKKNTALYFPHDAHASTGDTMTVLQGRFGNVGYAFWFKLLERLTAADDHYLDLNNPMKWRLFLTKMGVEEITTVEILNLLVEMEAIDPDLWGSKLIWCQKLVDNLADVYRNRRREIPQKPITTPRKAISTCNNAISTDSNTQSKVKYSKVNESKVNKGDTPSKDQYGEFKNVLLTSEEYQRLRGRFNQGTMSMIERLSAYIESTGKRYKSHYATILTWAERDTKEMKPGQRRGKGLAGPAPDWLLQNTERGKSDADSEV